MFTTSTSLTIQQSLASVATSNRGKIQASTSFGFFFFVFEIKVFYFN
jgi:hypothetical protein